MGTTVSSWPTLASPRKLLREWFVLDPSTWYALEDYTLVTLTCLNVLLTTGHLRTLHPMKLGGATQPRRATLTGQSTNPKSKSFYFLDKEDLTMSSSQGTSEHHASIIK